MMLLYMSASTIAPHFTGSSFHILIIQNLQFSNTQNTLWLVFVPKTYQISFLKRMEKKTVNNFFIVDFF